MSRLCCEASGRELLPRSRLKSGRLELLDGVGAGVGRDRSTPGCCEDCNRLRKASNEDDPRSRVDGELFDSRFNVRLGVALGCEDRLRIEGALREGLGVGAVRVGVLTLGLLGDGPRLRDDGCTDGEGDVRVGL